MCRKSSDLHCQIILCVNSVRIRRFSSPYFPLFGLNMNLGKYGPQ